MSLNCLLTSSIIAIAALPTAFIDSAEKTKGNISDEEVKILDQSISELKMNYVMSKEKADKEPDNKEKSSEEEENK